MNIPKLMTVKNQNKTVSTIKKVVTTVAEETVDDAVNETHDSAAATDKIVNTSVSGDGTWEQNGFSSFIGLFHQFHVNTTTKVLLQEQRLKMPNAYLSILKKHK